MLPILLMIAAIEVRRAGPPITLEEAQAMTPTALGDALLAPNHPPIVETGIGPEGMYPAVPPGMPVASEIRLFTAAHPAVEPGFCEKTKVTVTLAPVLREGGELPPARAEKVSLTKLYRWGERVDGKMKCDAPHYSFFQLDPILGNRSFKVIRVLATLRPSDVRTLDISVDDKSARATRDFIRDHPSEPLDMEKDAMTPITEGHIALKRFPVSSITMISSYANVWDDGLLHGADLSGSEGHSSDAVRIFAGGEWNVGLVLKRDKITAIRFIKAVPPPF